MKKIGFKYLVILIMLLLFPKIVFGEECTEEELKRLIKDAYKVEINYKFNKTNNFTLKFENLKPGILVSEKVSNNYFYYDENGEFIDSSKQYNDIYGGERYEFVFNAYGTCYSDKELRKTKINIPYYNEFSEHELCNNNEDFSLCKKFTYAKVNEETFLKRIKEYKQKKVNNKEKKDESESETKYNNKIIVIVITGIVFIILIGIIIISKRKGAKNKL